MVRKTAKSLMEERTCRGQKLNVRLNDTYQHMQAEHLTDLSGEIALGLELLEEGREEESGEEENDGPEQHIRDVRAIMSTGRTHKLAMKILAILERETTHISVILI